MREYGWDHWDDFRAMVAVVEDAPDRRRVRLAACALVRTVWDQAEDPRGRAAVEVAEAYVDDRAKKEQLKAAHKAADAAVQHAKQVLARDWAALPDLSASGDKRIAYWRL